MSLLCGNIMGQRGNKKWVSERYMPNVCNQKISLEKVKHRVMRRRGEKERKNMYAHISHLSDVSLSIVVGFSFATYHMFRVFFYQQQHLNTVARERKEDIFTTLFTEMH